MTALLLRFPRNPVARPKPAPGEHHFDLDCPDEIPRRFTLKPLWHPRSCLAGCLAWRAPMCAFAMQEADYSPVLAPGEAKECFQEPQPRPDH